MLIVYTACATEREAEKIAAALVKGKLAACASVSPCQSFYIWKGKFRKQGEFVVELKMRRANYQKAELLIKKLHSYDVPQIIAIKVEKASADYAEWVEGKKR